MIVSFGKSGKLTVTAETSVENQRLFELVNGKVGNTTATADTKEPKQKKSTSTKRSYTKSCPVEGCEHKAKSMKLHLRNAHGVLPDGTIKKTFTYNGGRRMKGADAPKHPVERPVAMPVEKTNKGYRVQGKHELLADEEPTGFRSRILN